MRLHERRARRGFSYWANREPCRCCQAARGSGGPICSYRSVSGLILQRPGSAIRHVVGASQDDLVVMDENGHELIVREAFKPLTRTGIRLARDDARSGPSKWECAMSEDRAARYLQIPAIYCRSFGGLRWAQYGEAVEFLEGPAAGHVCLCRRDRGLSRGVAGPRWVDPGLWVCLHLLYLIGLGDARPGMGRAVPPCVERIATPFRELGCPLRNAGALCSWLGRVASRVADPPDLAELHEILTGGSWVPQMVLSHRQRGVLGSGGRAWALVRRIRGDGPAARRTVLSDGEIHHWLRHGRGTGGNGPNERLLPIGPGSLGEVLIELGAKSAAGGDRSAGEQPGKCDFAAASPASPGPCSRMAANADVTTKGAPEQILPIQFALDHEEFQRRFAERELLYFHREEPRQPTTEEIVLLLDQGVRTWGDVRLVLAGAVIALPAAGQAAADRDQAGDHVQRWRGHRSDRARAAQSSSAHGNERPVGPSRCCSFAAAEFTRRRAAHIVLLTHPRNVGEPAVRDAARSLVLEGGDTRLFAVAVDATGKLELTEVRRGLPVAVGQSRVNLDLDLETAPAATTSSSAISPSERPGRATSSRSRFRSSAARSIASTHRAPMDAATLISTKPVIESW